MSPKGLLCVFVMALCATQMATANRDKRALGIGMVLNGAKQRIAEVVSSLTDAAGSSVKTVLGYIAEVEKSALTTITAKLNSFGIKIDLVSISDFVKSNVNLCADQTKVVEEAKDVISSLLGCTKEDTENLRSLVKKMEDLWDTAKILPDTMSDVAKQCGIQQTENLDEAALIKAAEIAEANTPVVTVEADTEDDAIQAILNEAEKEASQAEIGGRQKRFIWAVGRVINCVKSVYAITQTDVANIPSQIMTAATEGLAVLKKAKSGLTACANDNLLNKKDLVVALSQKVTACVNEGLTNKENVAALLEKNPHLATLKTIGEVALSVKGNGIAGAVGAVGKLVPTK